MPTFGRLMRVYGHSMAPALKPGELVFVSQPDDDSYTPQRGDIVAVRPASLGGKVFVKRIIGLPHERLQIDHREWQLKARQFFLLGDQATHSMDSRIFGPVTRGEVVGPVRLRVWPWKILKK